MQYTDLTRKELQREYSRLTRKYTDFIRQPVELDLTTEDSLELCRKAGVRFDAIDHCTVLARTIPEDIRSDELTHVASVFAVSARMAALESLQGTLMRA